MGPNEIKLLASPCSLNSLVFLLLTSLVIHGLFVSVGELSIHVERIHWLKGFPVESLIALDSFRKY